MVAPLLGGYGLRQSPSLDYSGSSETAWAPQHRHTTRAPGIRSATLHHDKCCRKGAHLSELRVDSARKAGCTFLESRTSAGVPEVEVRIGQRLGCDFSVKRHQVSARRSPSLDQRRSRRCIL